MFVDDKQVHVSSIFHDTKTNQFEVYVFHGIQRRIINVMENNLELLSIAALNYACSRGKFVNLVNRVQHTIHILLKLTPMDSSYKTAVCKCLLLC